MGDDDNSQRTPTPLSGMNVDFFARATDMTAELFELDMMLAGKNLNEDGEWEKDEDREPLMNAKGRGLVRTILLTALNKNTYMSDLRPERVSKMVFETSEDVQVALFLNRHEYGMDKMEIYSYVISIIENFLETAFARPIEGRERGIYNSITQESTHRLIESKDGGAGNLLSGILGKPKQNY